MLVEVCAAFRLAFHFAIFASIAQQWATVYHSVLSGSTHSPWRDWFVRYFLLSASGLVGLVFVVELIVIAASDVGSKQFENAIMAGT